MKKLTLALLIASMMAGCASFPDGYEKPLVAKDIRKQKRDEWSDLPAVTFVQSVAGQAVRKYDEIPAALLQKPINIKFDRTMQPTLSDVTFALGQQGFRLVSRLKDETMKQAWTIRSDESEHTVGDVLTDIAATYNVAAEYRQGTIYLVESNKYSAALPQHKEFMDTVAKALKDMGATDVRADVLAGLVYYNAKPEQAEYFSDYLSAISKNAAMVTLQVAVLTVGSDRGLNQGFDWSQLGVGHASGGMKQNLATLFANNQNSNSSGLSPNQSTNTTTQSGTNGTNGTSNGTNGTTSTSTSGSTTGTATDAAAQAAKIVTGGLLSFTGASGFGAQFGNNAFSLTAAIQALSTYGDARTEQNVILGTLSGQVVKINSGDDIPYVKSIGAATASGGATTGSSQTDTIKSGLKLELTPNFNATDGTVVTTVKVDMSTLVGFRELSAGINLGTMSEPQMKNLGFENVGRLSAGETLVMGGITYDQISNDYTNFPGLEKLPLGSKTAKTTRTAMYIVVRPTVVVFTPHAAELTAKLAALEAAAKAAQDGVPAGTPAAGAPAGAPLAAAQPVQAQGAAK